ncbi:hypothetical protein AX16_007160 [Volvariella volvacea WC 439]|nr:hypothetical protein AX16_007160 [Volvariella volvacea WC 439]
MRTSLYFATLAGLLTCVLGQVRIMPLGDSITGSPGCWRANLWTSLRNSGYTNIDMVGSLPDPGCGVQYDGDNEGHGGYRATNIANQNQLVGWLAPTKPDIVMMHLGTNDIWGGIATSSIITAFSKLVDQMRASNPNMKILVAQIIPMTPSNCGDCNSRVIALNSAIASWAPTKSTTNSPITVVDQFTGFNTATDTNDGVHPISSGNTKIAQKWLAPLQAAIRSVGGGSTTTPVPTTTPGGSVVPAWGQCGGRDWTGGTICASGTNLTFISINASQTAHMDNTVSTGKGTLQLITTRVPISRLPPEALLKVFYINKHQHDYEVEDETSIYLPSAQPEWVDELLRRSQSIPLSTHCLRLDYDSEINSDEVLQHLGKGGVERPIRRLHLHMEGYEFDKIFSTYGLSPSVLGTLEDLLVLEPYTERRKASWALIHFFGVNSASFRLKSLSLASFAWDKRLFQSTLQPLSLTLDPTLGWGHIMDGDELIHALSLMKGLKELALKGILSQLKPYKRSVDSREAISFPYLQHLTLSDDSIEDYNPFLTASLSHLLPGRSSSAATASWGT